MTTNVFLLKTHPEILTQFAAATIPIYYVNKPPVDKTLYYNYHKRNNNTAATFLASDITKR